MCAIDSRPSGSRHWAASYIGKPYESAARGPEAYDCWGLVWTIYRDDFKINLPEYPGVTLASLETQCTVILHDIVNSWEEVRTPFDGAGVALSKRAAIHHVGVYVVDNGGKILHATPEHGVVTNTVRQLSFQGFRVIKFYRHKLWPML